MRAGLARGYRVPRVSVIGRDQTIEPYVKGDAANPLYAPFAAFSAYVSKKADDKLAETIGFLPRRRHGMRPVPDAIAPIYTGGRGGLEACLMNTYNLPVLEQRMTQFIADELAAQKP